MSEKISLDSSAFINVYPQSYEIVVNGMRKAR